MSRQLKFVQTGEIFYKCLTCGRLERQKIGLLQKRHKNCNVYLTGEYEELTLPIGTQKALRKSKGKKKVIE